MNSHDIRWIQRLNNFSKAMTQLTKFIEKGQLNELEQQGLIQSFEYTHDLAWKTIKDFLKYQGNTELYGSRDATREAFKLGLIEEGEVWMDMIRSRNLTSHTYNENTAEAIATLITDSYYDEFLKLQNEMNLLAKKET